MKDIKSGIAKYRNCTISFTIKEADGKYFAHAQIHDPMSDNIETVWSDENLPFKSSGIAEAEIIKSAKEIIDQLFESR